MVSPLKKSMAYSGGKATPKGVPGVSMGMDGNKCCTPPKIMKGTRAAGEMYKKPGDIKQQGKNAKDMSSGQSNPTKGSEYDRKKYTQAKQPAQFSNIDNGGMKGTKFVC